MHWTSNIGTILIIALAFIALPSGADDDGYQRSKQKLEQLKERFASPSWVDGNSLSEISKRIFSRGATPNGLFGAKPEDSLAGEREADATEGPPTDAPQGPTAIGGTARQLPRWMPYCFLVDPAQDGEAVNEAIKTMADEYGQCGIALDVHAFTIQPGYPNDPDALNELARNACDFGRAFEVRGAIQVWNGNPQITQDMCDDPQAVGCSTLCERLSVSQVSPGQGTYVAMHESMHSNCCGRACVDPGAGTEPAGYGIFLVKNDKIQRLKGDKKTWGETGQEVPREGDETPEENQMSPAACSAIIDGTATNDGLHRWDPAKQTYYVAATDPAAQKELNGESFFKPKPKVPEVPLQGEGVSGKGGKGLAGNGDGNTISFTEAPKGRPTPDGKFRHQGKEGTNALLGNVRDKPSQTLQYLNAPGAGTGSGKGNAGPRISFNDEAKKRATTGGTSSGSDTASPNSNYQDVGDAMGAGDGFVLEFATPVVPESTGGSESARIGFNDSAKKGSVSGQGSTLSLPGGGSTAGAAGDPGLDPAVASTADRVVSSISSFVEGASALSSSLTSGFWETDEDEEEEERRKNGRGVRGASLRSPGGVQRDSSTGMKRRSDVIISTRPDPNFQVAPSQPYPGIY